jgi:Fe-S cluster biogenesis protein NfuA
MVQVQSIQPTPNPNAFKFVVDGILYAGTKSYATSTEAAGHALAETLFAIDGVDTLFFCDRFVTVSMKASADWRLVHEQATRALEAYQPDGDAPADASPEASESAASFDSSALDESERELLQRIDEVLDDRIRPALAGDGGGLEVVGLDGKTLQIRYQGACGSCPSSIAGTLMAIQNMLQAEVDEELSVVSV